MRTIGFLGLCAAAEIAACGDTTQPSSPPPADQCHPGQTIADPTNDVAPAYIDVTSLTSVLNGQTLEVTFRLRNVPARLAFDRSGVPQNVLEYDWSVFVDVDNNPQTGAGPGPFRGAEFELAAQHFVFSAVPTTEPIAGGVQTDVWEHAPGSDSWQMIGVAALSVDSQAGTLALRGDVPGITPESRLFFHTFDYNPGGSVQADVSSCAAP
jgi:hypothetical protein